MSFSRKSFAILAFGILPVMSGCVSMAPEKAQPVKIAQLPESFGDTVDPSAYQADGWWRAFQDPILNKLLDKALSDNLDLAETAARLKAAEAQAKISKSGLFPQINPSITQSYSDSPLAGSAFGGALGAGGGQASRIKSETYSPSLGLSYEIDLWGKLRDQSKAARADVYAAAADLQAARLAVMAETITSYFVLVDARAQIAVQVKTIDVLNDRTTQTESRYGRGLTSSFELYQIRQDYRNVQASLPQSEARLTAIEGQLSIITGSYVGELDEMLATKLQPRLVFESIPAGLPASLLIQRPDIVAAAQRLEAARLTAGARRAEQFPSINLSGSLGTQAADISGIFNTMDNWVLSLGASLTAPLFQGGRIRANIQLADAQYAQAAASYARAVITAYQEVRTAIDGYDEQRQRYRFLFSQQQQATQTTQLQSRRFASGVGDYSGYLDALRTQYQIESSLSSAGKDVAQARLSVHRALGGSWTDIETDNIIEMVPIAPKTNSIKPQGGR
jgi:NodT family efflux transporter outer membrane factor (OMF) lipoprotein